MYLIERPGDKPGLFVYLTERRVMKRKASDYKYPNIIMEMARNGDTFDRIADLLGITRQTVVAKLNGKSDFGIGEIETLCKYYKKDFYELFK